MCECLSCYKDALLTHMYIYAHRMTGTLDSGANGHRSFVLSFKATKTHSLFIFISLPSKAGHQQAGRKRDKERGG